MRTGCTPPLRGGGLGSGINASGTTVNVTGANSNAVHANGGSTVTLNGVRAISAQGNALFATKVNVTADAQTTLTGKGTDQMTVMIIEGGQAVLDGTTVQATGDGGGGIRVGVYGYLELKGSAVIETSGNDGIGVYSTSFGLRDINKFPVVYDGVSITTRGQNAYGVLASSTGRGLTVGAASVVTYGAGADGAQAQYNATLELNGTTITTNGDKAAGLSVGRLGTTSQNSIAATTGTTGITTNGDDASAIRVIGDTNDVHIGQETTLTTKGVRSHAISLEGGKTKTYSSTNPATNTMPARISVAGVDASAFRVTDAGSSLRISSTLPTIFLDKDSWTAKAEQGGEIEFSKYASVLGGGLWVGGADSMMYVAGEASAAGSRLRVDVGGTFDISLNDDTTGFSLGSLQGDGGRVRLGAPGNARNLTIDGSEDGTYAGEISGAGKLLRKGSGTLTLTGAQAFGFSGNVEITSGTLAIAGQAAEAGVGKTFRFVKTGDGTMDISKSTSGVTVGVLQSVSAGNGVIQLGSNSLTVAGAADSDFSGSIQGAGGLIKQGTANLTLTGAEAFGYSGTTSILNGKITALGSTATASGHAVEIASAGTLDLTGASNFAVGTINGSGTILLGSNNIVVDGAGNSLFSGAITGAGGLTKLGAGVLKLSGTSAFGFGGDATIRDGVLAIRGNVDPATFSKRFVLQGGWLDLSEFNAPPTEGTAHDWPELTIDTTGATSGGVIGSDDNVHYDVDAGKNETVPYHLGDGTTPNGQGIFVVKTGAGTLELANQNYYVGNTRVEGGILRIRADGNLGGQINGTPREVVLNGGDLQVAGSFTSARDIEMRQNGAVTVDTGVATSWKSIQGASMILAKRGDGSIVFSEGGALGGASVEAGILALNNATVGATNVSAPVQMRGGNFSLSHGSIISSDDAIVATANSTVTLSDDVAIQAPGAAYRVTGNAQATLNLNAMRNADFRIAADGVDTELQINLDQHSSYVGVPMTAGGAKIGLALKDADSLWTVPSNAMLYSLDNRGNIEFTAPTGEAYKSVEVKGDYAGGGRMTLHTVLNAGGTLERQQTDRLLVQGNATGQTVLTLNTTGSGANTNVAGNNAYMPDEGISLVQVGGAASADAFKLANDLIALKGGLQYRLFAYGTGSLPAPDQDQNLLGDTPLKVDFRLQSLYIKNGEGNGRLALVPQGSSYLSAGMAMQRYSGFVLDNLHRRLGDVRQSDNAVGEAATVESYARFIGGRNKYRSDRSFNDYGYDFDQDYQALQFGANWLASGDAQQHLRLGGAITLGSSKVKPNAQDSEKSKFSMDGRSVALNATWTHHSGWYADGILSFGRYSGFVETDHRGNVGKLRGDSYDMSAEIGRTLVFASGLLIQPQFQLRSQTLRIQSLTDDDGVKVTFGKQQIWSGRVGVLASYPLAGPQGLTPYVRIDLLHSAGAAGKVNLSGVEYVPGRVGSAVQLSIGANGMVTRNTSLYGEISGQRRLGGYGFSGGDINLGVRHRF